MKLTKPYRGQRPTKRLDLSDMRELFRDRRAWCVVGRVTVPDGAAQHFEITDTDILVDVVTQPGLHDVTCRLAAGMWLLPDVGEEVVIAIPEGEMAFMPTVIGILSTGIVPSDQGPTPQRIAIVRQEVVVHDGTGGAEELVRKGEFNTFRAWVEQQFDAAAGHKHAVTGAVTAAITTVAVTGTANPTIPVPTVAGTQVLKGK